jgi:hypothetical protein
MRHANAFCKAWQFWLGYIAYAVAFGSLVGWIEGWAVRDWWWFGLVTSSTLGYGDKFPVTDLGRLATAPLIIGGIFLLATVVANAVYVAKQWDDDDGKKLFDRLAELEAKIDHVHTDVHPKKQEDLRMSGSDWG